MNKDIIIGCIILILTLGFIAYIVIRSRRIIEKIKEKKLRSAREIIKEINGRR